MGLSYSIMTTDVTPILNDTYSVGNQTLMYKNLYISQNVFVYGNMRISGDLIVGKSAILYNATINDTLIVNDTIQSGSSGITFKIGE